VSDTPDTEDEDAERIAAEEASREDAPKGLLRTPSGRWKTPSGRVKTASGRWIRKAIAAPAEPKPGEGLDLQDRIDWYLNEPASVPGRIAEVVIGLLILAVVAINVVTSYQEVPAGLRTFLTGLETTITIVFLIEYLVRWWAKHFSVRYLFT